MKIKTITCQNADNHGARLQALALAAYLQSRGHETEIIDYRPGYMRFATKLWYWPGRSPRQWAKLLLQYRQRRTALLRHEAMDSFSRAHLPLTRRTYLSLDELTDSPPEADLYLAGSDQIWNTLFPNGTDPAYYLQFAPPSSLRASYAASFATPKLREGTSQFVAQSLSQMHHISVREASGLALLSSLGLSGELVVDPVFLLSPDDWNAMLPQGRDAKPYVLVYDMVAHSEAKRLALRLSKMLGCQVYSIAPRPARYASRDYSCASPLSFVSLVRDASCVVSDSFHATAFAILYQRPFFVVRRGDGLNGRMEELTSRYALSHRITDGEAPTSLLAEPVHFGEAIQRLSADIQRSKAFLDRITNQTTPA